MNDLKPKRSVSAREAWLRALQRTASIEANPTRLLAQLIDEGALRFGDAPALVSATTTWSHREFAAQCRRYARWGYENGFVPGDQIALFLGNCPDYLACWVGLSRIGVVVALINTHLVRDSLIHCLRLAQPRAIIVGVALERTLAAVLPALEGVEVWTLGADAPGRASLDRALQTISAEFWGPDTPAAPPLAATALLIYTSGTTGLPKAAKVSHFRVLQWSLWFAGMLDTQSSDRLYNCLPLYHSVGGVVACGAPLLGGGSVVIRERFSASDFWRDLREERCTLFQYIGELCRYLVNTPADTADGEHSLRMVCGNGLRPEIWTAFKTRFRIPHILEYYAATEGNFSLYNCEEKPGAIGRIPPFLSQRLPVALVQMDHERGEPRRGANGRCERCAVDEPGEALGQIPTATGPAMGRFEGYSDAAASARKVLHDVFAPCDAWYRTGDLMRRDARGFFYFVDRLGDTYRWKGENVSTAEVTSVLSACPGVREGIVYGVTVPGADGRAGMASLVVDAAFDLAAFRAHVIERLPTYQRPVFLRLTSALDATATFKLTKPARTDAAFDPRVVTDPLYVEDSQTQAYVRLDASIHTHILTGARRL